MLVNHRLQFLFEPRIPQLKAVGVGQLCSTISLNEVELEILVIDARLVTPVLYRCKSDKQHKQAIANKPVKDKFRTKVKSCLSFIISAVSWFSSILLP
ncbi:hypothetical protein [Pleurocapsa sp. PCC 7319]|uniref:hypothetical protein n=1 Tax=Pleurocapsa sp. PCC 7319 TaxID=118161 RepID=UPI000381FB6C|nr:hypothetical protein [Pleurocapsa sp. PCC 7319]